MNRRRILLVEDDAPLRQVLRRHLEARGFQVDEAGSVAEAINALQQLPPDLLVLDIGLPDGSGWDVAGHARHLAGDSIPILVCSSHPFTQECLARWQVAGYLAKPFEVHRLCECIVAALAPAREGRTLSGSAEGDPEVAFFASLAHDLRTPMTTLRASVESLLAGDVEWDEEARREFLSAIAASAERVSRYARDLLDLARLDAGAWRPAAECVPAEETLEALAEALQYEPGAPRVSFRLAPDVGPAWGDPACILRILLCVVENALQRSPAGAEVTVEVCPAPGEVHWRVTDRGPGVPPGERERVFDRHYRVQCRQPRSKNPAISLYICRELARLQGGRIWAEAAEGGGARFCLALPAYPQSRGAGG